MNIRQAFSDVRIFELKTNVFPGVFYSAIVFEYVWGFT